MSFKQPGEIPPSPPFSQEGGPRNLEPGTQNPLLESLAWLNFCLGETAAAMAAVQEAALAAMQAPGAGACMADDQQKTCSTCAYKSDGINTLDPDYCYCLDKTVKRDDPACGEHRESLRDEPIGGPPV